MKNLFRTMFPPLLFVLGLILVSAGNPSGVFFILAALALCLPAGLQARLYTFPSNCEGRIVNVSASTGCTLTRASILGMTPAGFEAQGFTEVGYDKIYATAREARVAGYMENSWTSLLMSRITNIKGALAKSRLPGNESVVLPYFPRRQKRIINTNYWKVASGSANPQAGQGDIPASAWDIVVQNNPSSFGSTLQNLEQYFLPGTTLYVEYTGANTVAYSNAYKIVKAATVAGVTTVTAEPNYSPAGWAALTAAQKAVYQIGGVGGGNAQAGSLAYLGVNSVSNFESWGGQDNAENTNSLLYYWPQTSRLVHEYTDEYNRGLNAALTSNYFKMFRQLPLAEQKRRQRQKYDEKMLNSAFFGQRINEFQTVENYRSLPQVVDPANPGCLLEYKSNALGFHTQLSDCNRMLDHQGNALNLDSLLNAGFLVKRARMADGSIGMDDEPIIDVVTDPSSAGMIRDIFLAYYKQKWGVNIDRFYKANETLKFEGQVMFKYSTYQVPDELGGYVLAVFSSEVLRDRLAAASGANRQRYIFMLDWTDIELGIIETMSVERRTNEADQLYMYTPKVNVKHVSLESTTWAPIIEDPNRHYLVKNFSNLCPVLTVSGCNVQAPS